MHWSGFRARGSGPISITGGRPGPFVVRDIRSFGSAILVRVADIDEPLWRCASCGRTFANRNQTHTCAELGELDRHFATTAPSVRASFERVLDVVAKLGPVTVLAEKSRIALHVRMSFAAFMPRREWLNGHLVLARQVDNPRFHKIETYSPRNVLHAFRLRSPAEVDEEFAGWLAEAYHVGEQRHLRRANPG